MYPLSNASASSTTGAPADLDVSTSGDETVLRIGNPDKSVSGTQTYVVKYHLEHVVNQIRASKGQPAHVELYWNITGLQTGIPTDQVKVSVHGPAAVTQVRCLRGGPGSTQTCQGKAGSAASFSASGLGAYQGVTVVAAFPANAFSNTAPDLVKGDIVDAGQIGARMSEGLAKTVSGAGIGLGFLLPLTAAALMGLLVYRRGRDEQYAGVTPGLSPADGAPGQVTRGSAGPTAVQFTPPKGVQPGLVGTVYDESADTIDVSATVIDLAVRGYLRIEEVDEAGLAKLVRRHDWQLTRLEPPQNAEPLADYESTVLHGLFAQSDPVRLSELKNHFHSTLTTAQRQMYGQVVQRGWFRKNPVGQRSTWRALGIVLVVLGLILLFVWGAPSNSVDGRSGIHVLLPSGVLLGLGLVVAGLIVMVLGRRMAARTAAGSAVLAQTRGFRQYLETAEANQIKFEEASDIFSRYLPYAIVFGLADRWAKVFGKVAEAARSAGYPLAYPGWYVFSGNPAFYGFAGIANGVDSFANTAGGTFTSTPGSSGSSGFGGGGFSGGGGGGGGSGSW